LSTLTASKSAPTERDDGTDLDTTRIQNALLACKGQAVKLVSDGENNAFVTGHLQIDSVTLWIDQGTTLYASRNPTLYQKTGNCGSIGISDSGACTDFITLAGTSPGIVGDGIIDGQGGEPLARRGRPDIKNPPPAFASASASQKLEALRKTSQPSNPPRMVCGFNRRHKPQHFPAGISAAKQQRAQGEAFGKFVHTDGERDGQAHRPGLFVSGRQSQPVHNAMDGQRQHHGRGEFGQTMRGGLVKMAGRACRTDMVNIFGDECEKEIARSPASRNCHPRKAARHSGAMPQTATPSSVPAPRLMKAQSCLCVRASHALNAPPASAMANAAKIWNKMGVVTISFHFNFKCKSFAS